MLPVPSPLRIPALSVTLRAVPSFQVIVTEPGETGRPSGTSKYARVVPGTDPATVDVGAHCTMILLPTSGSAPRVTTTEPVVRLSWPAPYAASAPRSAPSPLSESTYQRPPDKKLKRSDAAAGSGVSTNAQALPRLPAVTGIDMDCEALPGSAPRRY